jgi:PBP1b-binding outer membrane lipoprotein LpoB
MNIWKSMAAVVMIGVVLVGCGSKEANVNSAEAKPTLSVKTEVSGSSVTLQIETDLKLAPDNVGKARKAGEGHIHVSLDGGEKITVSQHTHTLKDLSKGPHKLNVSLHNNDHTPYEVGQALDFEVK